jgi:hypothetical protein
LSAVIFSMSGKAQIFTQIWVASLAKFAAFAGDSRVNGYPGACRQGWVI